MTKKLSTADKLFTAGTLGVVGWFVVLPIAAVGLFHFAYWLDERQRRQQRTTIGAGEPL